jgi:hypothetical protein
MSAAIIRRNNGQLIAVDSITDTTFAVPVFPSGEMGKEIVSGVIYGSVSSIELPDGAIGVQFFCRRQTNYVQYGKKQADTESQIINASRVFFVDCCNAQEIPRDRALSIFHAAFGRFFRVRKKDRFYLADGSVVRVRNGIVFLWKVEEE